MNNFFSSKGNKAPWRIGTTKFNTYWYSQRTKTVRLSLHLPKARCRCSMSSFAKARDVDPSLKKISRFLSIDYDVNAFSIEDTFLVFWHRFSCCFPPICNRVGISSLDMREEKNVPTQPPASGLQPWKGIVIDPAWLLVLYDKVAILSSLDCWMLEFCFELGSMWRACIYFPPELDLIRRLGTSGGQKKVCWTWWIDEVFQIYVRYPRFVMPIHQNV
jgi:hypothetical protein